MAIVNLPANSSKQSTNKCIMCEGSMEKANTGMICNTCKDKMMTTKK